MFSFTNKVVLILVPEKNVSDPKVWKSRAFSLNIKWNPAENINGYTKGYQVSNFDEKILKY